MPDPPPIPSVVAMLVCDQIISEQGTGKKSLIGIFETLFSLGFPAPARLAVYAKLVDAQGRYRFQIRLVNLKDEKAVADLSFEGNITDPLSSAELGVNMANIMLPEPGRYEFQLYANDIYLHRVTMNVVQGGPPWLQPRPAQ